MAVNALTQLLSNNQKLGIYNPPANISSNPMQGLQNIQAKYPATSSSSSSSNNSSSGGGSTQKQNGGWYNGVQYWAPGQGPSAPSSNNNNSGPQLPDTSQIDAAFQPQFDAFNQMEGQVRSDNDAFNTNAQNTFNDQDKTIGGYVDSLNNNVQQGQNQWQGEQDSAYSSALRAYNALQQRNSVLYGGGNGSSEAADKFLQDDWNQQQNTFSNLAGQAGLAFKGQLQDVANWGATQHANLSKWFRDAQQQIQTEFSAALAQVNGARAATETERSQAKLGLITTYVQHQQEVADLNTQFQRQVQLAMATMPQGGQFDQSAYLNQMNSLGQSMNALPQQLSQQAQINYSAPVQTFTGVPLKTNNTDQFSQLSV